MPSLNYATTGPGLLYNTIGWFDFSSIPANAPPNTSYTLVNDIQGGGKITATFTLTSTNPAMVFNAQVPPTWAGAAFANTAYKGLTQKVCLREGGAGTGTITVTNIDIRDKFNNAITSYNFYFTDSETPASGETETFTTNGTGWQQFYQMPNSGYGFATLTGLGTTIVNATGLGNVPILLTKNPTSITQTVLGAGAMSFGISLIQIELYKIISARLSPTDQFKLDITGPNSGTTITAGTATGLQQQNVQVTSGIDGAFTFNESMAPGSTSPLSYYSQTIQLSNKTSGGTTLPSTISLGSPITLVNGDYAVMTITNTPANTVVTLNKTVDKKYSGVNETLQYTLVVKNSSPYPVNNVVVTDTIPTNTSFITNTLTLNGNPVSGSPNPPTGVSVGTLQANEVATITFNVQVTSTIPSPNRAVNNSTTTFTPTVNIGSVNSQTVVTTINGVVMNSTKSASKAYAQVGDIITYTIVLKNTGNVTASNILFLDTIPNNTSFISGTFKQDTTTIVGSPNTPGVTLPNVLKASSTTTVTFQVKVDSFPTPNPIPNSAVQSYVYTIDPSVPNGASSASNTNTVYVQVNGANLAGIIKYTDKNYATCNDVINYTVVIPNSGNITAQNVIFKDTIPNGTSFVLGSFKANEITINNVNLNTGVTLPDISGGTTTTITYQIKVIC